VKEMDGNEEEKNASFSFLGSERVHSSFIGRSAIQVLVNLCCSTVYGNMFTYC
jgi:hypothetical protein